MTQARHIYDFLRQWKGPSADRALVLALRHVEPPYDTVIVETLLERGRTEPIAELVKSYHELSEECRSLILGRAETLFGGLRLVVGDDTPQTRLNAIDIIQKTRYRRLLDVVLMLLRDRRGGVSQRASDVLLELVADFPQVERMASMPDPAASYTDGDAVRTTMKLAVANSRIYRRPEMVLAAMHVALPDENEFWQDRLEMYHPVHRTVGSLMISTPRPSLAAFYLMALKCPGLRVTAARTLAVHVQPEMVRAVARAYAAMTDELVTAGLRRVRDPRWLVPKLMETIPVTDEDRGHLLTLLDQVEASAEQKAACLEALLEGASEALADQAVKIMGHWPVTTAIRVCQKIMQGPWEIPAVRAMVLLLQNRVPQARRILAQQLNSAHSQVRELARRYFRQQAFISYWHRFDYLTLAQRIKAGQVIFKIDPDSPRRWQHYARHTSADQRLRAARVAAILEGKDCFLRDLWRMTSDSDSKVRSCAVKALARVASQAEQTNQLLLAALDDTDPRVRANAVEALDERQVAVASGRFQNMMVHEHNRVRANAIKAMLNRRVDSARQAVETMLQDPRHRHRLSAQWVVRQLQTQKRGPAASGVAQERNLEHEFSLVSG